MYANAYQRIPMKNFRQAAVLDLVSREPITSQEGLRQHLRARGFEATQATISRDIRDLGLVKRASDGAYQRPEAQGPGSIHPALGVRKAVEALLRRLDRVDRLVVLKTDPGQAQMLALAIDKAELSEVVGTVAGDDTILVITRDARRALGIARRFEGWALGVRQADWRSPSQLEPTARRRTTWNG